MTNQKRASPIAGRESVRHSAHRDVFDYVIVGAGAAGCVLANRLSADPDASVLLLEAGGKDHHPLVRIPAGFAKLMGSKYNWIIDTAPQRHLNNRRLFLPQGKGLGGGTSINAMLYMRGHRADYDEWRDLGNEGWSYEDVLPHFKRFERNARLVNEYHGADGELSVVDQVGPHPLSAAFVRAAQEAGIPYTPDPNGASPAGVYYHQVTQRGGWRESAATAFLRPIFRRSNLTVLTDATVTRVLVGKGRAIGVEYHRRGESRTAYAESELILSAGAINSPKLLLLSGIGPADELQDVGIEVVHHLPGVGKNLHDQVEVYLTAECSESISYTGQDRWHRALLHALQWSLYKTGPAAATISEAGAYLSSTEDVRSPDIQLHFQPAHVVWGEESRAPLRVKTHGCTVLVCNPRPRSRGEVRLASTDPADMPIVDPNYLADPEDWKPCIEGFRWAREILRSPALSSLLKGESMPGKYVASETAIRDYFRSCAKTDYHPVGSCKMGTDGLAVVDAQLRVIGLERLRVIDSSIMPSIVSGNTQAPSMMIGEKGAALVQNRRSADTPNSAAEAPGEALAAPSVPAR
jgi:choline dehydrogenase